MALRMSFSKQAKMTGPARAPTANLCTQTQLSTVPTNAATDRPTERTDLQSGQTDRLTNRQKDRQIERPTDIQTTNRQTTD